MAGLIYKNFCMIKDKLLSMLGVGIGVIVIFELLLLSVRYGNLKTLFPDMDSLRNQFIQPAYAIAGAMFLLPVVMFETFLQDKTSGFREMQYSMPILPKKKVMADYITFYGFIGMIYLVNIGATEMYFVTLGINMQYSDMKILYFIFAAASLLYGILIPSMYISIKGIAVIGGFLYLIFAVSMIGDNGKSLIKIVKKIFSMSGIEILLSFVLLTGYILLSGRLAVFFEERRCRQC